MVSRVPRLCSWLVAEPELEPGKSGSKLREVWPFQAELVSGLAGTGGTARGNAETQGRGPHGPGRE